MKLSKYEPLKTFIVFIALKSLYTGLIKVYQITYINIYDQNIHG